MLIVDSQVHIWYDSALNALHRQVRTFSKEDLLREMDEAGVDAAVIHPPGVLAPGNEWAVEAATAHPDRLSILGWIPTDDVAAGKAKLATWKQRPGMLGLRFTFMAPYQRNWATDGSVDWLWPEAERLGLPVGFIAHTALPKLARIAEKHPGMRILVDHFGVAPVLKDAAAFATLPDLLKLAKFPNVGVKLSGAPSNSSDPYPYRNIHDYIHRIFDAFGPQRCFWGTDITRMPCTYRQCVTMFTEELPWLKGKDLDLVMGRALCDWIGWKLPAK